MTIYLYQQTAAETFRLSERALLKIGFTVHQANDKTGFLSGRKQLNSNGHILFLDVKISRQPHTTGVTIISNVFAGNTGTFIADSVSEELFLETFHDLLRIQPPDNPFRLSNNDYAMAVGF